ncbi:MAG: S8 family peptidase [Pseudomonadota bacterium]|nr:S8 family peptidase [Pseudomonadota bacterium]
MIIKSILALSITVALGSSAMASELRRVENPLEGKYIVVLKEDSLTGPGAQGLAIAVEQAAVDLAAKFDLNVERVYGHALAGFAVDASEQNVARLLNDPRVEYVEEDSMVYPTTTQSGATWGLDRVDQRDRPLNGTYIYTPTASNVRVYVIDSGILASHTQFGGRVLAGATAISDGRGSSDCNGHGTHVAGTIGGSTWGVAKAVKLVPVRVFGCTGGSANSTIISGIDWVRANAVRPAVANMSLGGGASSATDTATNNLINSGVTVVVAAGNDNANACNYSPARVANAITVGSTSSNDYRSSFSNYGSCVNIFAPGSSIKSAWYTSTSATNTISGTSMASPHVAGAAALYLSGNTGASPATVRSALYNKSTTGRLYSIGSGSPNRLLYTR